MANSVQNTIFDTSFINILNHSQDASQALFHYSTAGETTTISAYKKRFWNHYKPLFSKTHNLGKIAELFAQRVKQQRGCPLSTIRKCMYVLSQWKKDLNSTPPFWNLLGKFIRWIKRKQIHESIQKITTAIEELQPLVATQYTGTFLDEAEKDTFAKSYLALSSFLSETLGQQESRFNKALEYGWNIMEAPIVLKGCLQSSPPQGGVSCVVFPNPINNHFDEIFEKLFLSENGKRYIALFINLGPLEKQLPHIVSLLIDRDKKQVYYFNPYNEEAVLDDGRKSSLERNTSRTLLKMLLPDTLQNDLITNRTSTTLHKTLSNTPKNSSLPTNYKTSPTYRQKDFVKSRKSLRGVVQKVPKERRGARLSLPVAPTEFQYPQLKKEIPNGKKFPETSLENLRRHGYTIIEPKNIRMQTTTATGSFFAAYNILNFFKIFFKAKKETGTEEIPLHIWEKLYEAVPKIRPNLKRVTGRPKLINRAQTLLLGIFGCYLRENKCKRFSKAEKSLDERYIQAAFPNQSDACYRIVKWINEQFVALEDRAKTDDELNFMVPVFEILAEKLRKNENLFTRKVSYLLEDLSEIFLSNSDFYQNTNPPINNIKKQTIDLLLEKREMAFFQKPPPPPRRTLQRTKV